MKFEKVTAHIKDNKKTYLSTSAGFVSGVIVGLVSVKVRKGANRKLVQFGWKNEALIVVDDNASKKYVDGST